MSDATQTRAQTQATVRVTVDAGVMTVRIDRPHKKNALDGATYRGLTAALGRAVAEPAVRVIVLTGGPEVFTSGNDLGDFARVRSGGGDLAAMDFLRALVACGKPIVASVAGWAVGIGTTMLLHCDFVYVTPSARLRTPFVDLGLCAEGASTVLLPRLVGARRANELLLLGKTIDGATAHAWGLASEVVDDAEVRAQEVARELATRAPGALQATKALLQRARAAEIEAAFAAEQAAFLARLTSPEAAEAAMAMMTKRAPDFSRF